MENTLRDLVKNQAALARDVGVSVQTIRIWLEINAIPPRRVIAVANALDVEITDLLPFAQKTYKPVSIKPKTLDDLRAVLEGNYDPDDPSAQRIKGTWGDRLPLLYTTLAKLQGKGITVTEAAEILGITKSAVHNIRKRYGTAPGPIKGARKPEGRYKLGAKEARKLALDVIAGPKTAKSAAEGANISLRTLHRHIEDVLRPLYLNEISHWSKNFRLALAYEIEKNMPKHSEMWRNWAEERHLLLKKAPSWPKPPANWREVSIRGVIIAILTREHTVTELAAMRGGEAHILAEHVERELRQMGTPALSLTTHHQAAAAEIILARDSHFRSKHAGP
jgi:transcriptional regulator with XRE-family HTH domain/predicted transcriptional regulator